MRFRFWDKQPEQENYSSEKGVHILQKLNNDYKGWTDTNEDHWLLLEGLKGVHRPGGFFAVGEFHVLDIALQIGATSVVLGDLDWRAVEKNATILRIVEQAQHVDEVLPRILEYIKKTYDPDGFNAFLQKLTSQGAQTGARIRLSWAHDQKAFQKLQSMIKEGRIALAQVDITDPESMRVVGQFFAGQKQRLETAYLSNTISHTEFAKVDLKKHRQAVQALETAGGHRNTLLIRSGEGTNPQIMRKMFSNSPDFLTQIPQIVAKTEQDREKHYGKNVKVLPEAIDRAITGSLAQYDFEFFTQSLEDYKKHMK